MNIIRENRRFLALVVLGAIAVFAAAVFFVKSENRVELPGEGTTENPYDIKSAADLYTICMKINNGELSAETYMALSADIDMSEISDWTPLGGEDGVYYGVFNGRGHRIRNFSCKDVEDAGFVDHLGGTVANLIIESGYVSGSDESGCIAAKIEKGGSVINCISRATVTGGKAGGIAGKNEGLIINCVSNPTEEESEMKIAGKTEKKSTQNCYTRKGGHHEILNFSSEEVDRIVYNTAGRFLNERIAQLSLEYPDVPLCLWTVEEDGPMLTQDVAESVVVVKDGSENFSYDYEDHCWKGKSADSLDIILRNGETVSADIDKAAGIVVYERCGVKSFIEFTDRQAIETERVFIDEAGKEIDRDTYINVTGVSEYELSGDINGQVVCDTPVKLILNNAKITSRYAPAITIRGKDKGIIVLKDGTDNLAEGVNWIDVYTKSKANEGAVSMDTDAEFTGKGSLTVKGSLEGIEGADELIFNGGVFHVYCPEDALAASDDIYINDGYLYLNGDDDLVDPGMLEMNGGVITGCTETEHALNTERCHLNGGVVMCGSFMGIAGFGGDEDPDSALPRVEFKFPEALPEGTILVLTDEDDAPIAAQQLEAPSVRWDVCMEGLNDKNLKVYKADSVDGEFADGICLSPQSFKGTAYTCGGSEKLRTHDDGFFEID